MKFNSKVSSIALACALLASSSAYALDRATQMAQGDPESQDAPPDAPSAEGERPKREKPARAAPEKSGDDDGAERPARKPRAQPSDDGGAERSAPKRDAEPAPKKAPAPAAADDDAPAPKRAPKADVDEPAPKKAPTPAAADDDAPAPKKAPPKADVEDKPARKAAPKPAADPSPEPAAEPAAPVEKKAAPKPTPQNDVAPKAEPQPSPAAPKAADPRERDPKPAEAPKAIDPPAAPKAEQPPAAPAAPAQPDPQTTAPTPPPAGRDADGQGRRPDGARPARPGQAADPAAPGGRGGGRQPDAAPSAVKDMKELKQERKERSEDGGKRIVIEEPDKRIIVKEGGRTIIRHDETERFRRLGGGSARREKRDGLDVSIMIRPGGIEIFTETDDRGRALRRYRRDRNGREVILFDNRDYYRRNSGGSFVDAIVDLPPPRYTIPRGEYVVDYEEASDEDVYEALSAPPVEALDRAYSMEEVRRSPMLRDRMRRVDLDAINFEFGAWEVAADQFPALERVARAMMRVIEANPGEMFLVEGHTDAVGSDDDNLSLSDRRAETVSIILTEEFGVPPENMTTQGYGEQYLKVDTGEAERQNRRVAVRRITPLLSRSK